MFEAIDFAGWPWWAIATILLALNLIKPIKELLAGMFPQLFGFLTKRAEAEQERQLFEADAERQDDVTLWSSMVQLQTEAIRQNEKLLDFIIQRLDTRLSELAQTIKQELGQIRQELDDIGNRWLTASKETIQNKSQVHLLTIEISKLVDKMGHLENKLGAFEDD